jgi:hypothetical protein
MSWLFSRALVEEYLEDTSLDGERSVQLNGKPTQQAYCVPDKMTDFLKVSRYGMTFAALTADRGEELLMSYLEDFHAKTSQQEEKGLESKESGQECGPKWRGSFAKFDPDSYLWKTHQCSLVGDLEEFSQTWPQWGLMRGGECWEQQTLAQTISATESGLLAKMWPTPTVACVEGGEQSERVERTESGGYILRKLGKPHMTYGAKLSDAVLYEEKKKNNLTGGRLNPTFTEWLMGWPLGWTKLEPLETDKFPCVQQPLGES